MEKIFEEQEVILFADKELTDKQSVLIDRADPIGPWLVVTHCDAEISLSLENWDKLTALVEKANLRCDAIQP